MPALEICKTSFFFFFLIIARYFVERVNTTQLVADFKRFRGNGTRSGDRVLGGELHEAEWQRCSRNAGCALSPREPETM